MYVMNAGGSGQPNLTHKPAGDFSPPCGPQRSDDTLIRRAILGAKQDPALS